MSNDAASEKPKYVFLSLTAPAEVALGESDWTIDGQVLIRGMPAEANDTPWVSFPDLLIDEVDRTFVGLTFEIDRDYRVPMQRIAQLLNPQVVRYNDLCHAQDRRVYHDDQDPAHRLEITWIRPRRQGFELAQLLCGQWFWWYSIEGNWGICPPILALSITDIDEILDSFALRFPKLSLPVLDVRM
jgi:hypothetical protein